MKTKAITLSQPFASLVAVGAKTILTCPDSTAYRGTLFIHADAEPANFIDPYHGQVLTEAGMDLDNLQLGAVIAQCCLTECHLITAANCPCYPEYAFSDFKPGLFAWKLTEVRMLPEHIPVEGKDGL